MQFKIGTVRLYWIKGLQAFFHCFRLFVELCDTKNRSKLLSHKWQFRTNNEIGSSLQLHGFKILIFNLYPTDPIYLSPHQHFGTNIFLECASNYSVLLDNVDKSKITGSPENNGVPQ